MWCQDQVLDVLNHTAELATRGLAAILLQKNGDVHDSRSVRPGLLVPLLRACRRTGSPWAVEGIPSTPPGAGWVSYWGAEEYVLKDSIFLGSHANPVARGIWDAFRAKLPNLLVEASSRRAIHIVSSCGLRPKQVWWDASCSHLGTWPSMPSES